MYFDKNQLIALSTQWKVALKKGFKPAAKDFYVYNILRNLPPERGFRKPNDKKLKSQGFQNWGFLKAALDTQLRSFVIPACFAEIATPDVRVLLTQELKFHYERARDLAIKTAKEAGYGS